MTSSILTAHEKIADAAATTWFASTGFSILVITARTSLRPTSVAGSLDQRGSRKRSTSARACGHDLFLPLACSR